MSWEHFSPKKQAVFHLDSWAGVMIWWEVRDESHSAGALRNSQAERSPDFAEQLKQVLPVTKKKPIFKVLGPSKSKEWIEHELTAFGILEKYVEIESAYEVILDFSAKRLRLSRAQVASSIKSEIRVLIIDDSLTIRNLLQKTLSQDPSIKVVGAVGSPSEALEAIPRLRPDVITLDIHLPEMNGVELLRRYLPHHPIPTVMVSSISMQEGPLVIQALEQGAVDYIQKPSLDQLGPVMQMMIEKVKTAAVARVRIGNTSTVKRVIKSSRPMEVDSLVVVGSSTGGTEALRVLFESFPSEIPPVLVVQHIPAVFSKAFADRMNTLFPFEVKEASDGDLVTPNRILIAPGGTQMSIDGRTQQLKVMIDPDASPVNRHKPSVEVLFQSAKGLKKKHLVAIMLTGMGADGAKSMKELRDLGARTIAQNEESCVVFGMPQAAIKLGGVEFVEPLDQIGSKVFDLIQKGKAA